MAIIPFRKNEQKKLYVIDKKIETTKTNNDLEYYDNNYEDSEDIMIDDMCNFCLDPIMDIKIKRRVRYKGKYLK